jgi:lipoprotein signal peptidase
VDRAHRYAQGYTRRMMLLLAVGLVVFAVDQFSKVIASAVHPAHYVQNPSTEGAWWLPFGIAAVACTVPFRPFTVALALAIGGAAGNIFDVYFWPGGVPDFIYAPTIVDNGIWNLADAFIVVGTFLAAGTVFALWPLNIAWRRRRSVQSEEAVEPRAGGPLAVDELDAVERAR